MEEFTVTIRPTLFSLYFQTVYAVLRYKLLIPVYCFSILPLLLMLTKGGQKVGWYGFILPGIVAIILFIFPLIYFMVKKWPKEIVYTFSVKGIYAYANDQQSLTPWSKVSRVKFRRSKVVFYSHFKDFIFLVLPKTLFSEENLDFLRRLES